MKLVIFGLTISSSWGNGHATLWRGLCRALSDRGHSVTFFERDAPYYAAHRDTVNPPGCDLRLYGDWDATWQAAVAELNDADVAIVTSFCPDAGHASSLVLASDVAVKAYYDMDTPLTLDGLSHGERPAYIPEHGLGEFDVVLSYSGGRSLGQLQSLLGARYVAPLYGSVDPSVHHPVEPQSRFESDLSYLGTYAANRNEALDTFFMEAARRRPSLKFLLAGSQYPENFRWAPNVFYLSHLPPGDHAAFYSSSGWTLNITRGPMAALGHCPSGRLFEAAACGTAIVTDAWDGLEGFFTPGEEIFLACHTGDVLLALDMDATARRRLGARARERALDCHTADVRASELEQIVERACRRAPALTRQAAPEHAGSMPNAVDRSSHAARE
jgi:spore maturation protein CgeB